MPQCGLNHMPEHAAVGFAHDRLLVSASQPNGIAATTLGLIIHNRVDEIALRRIAGDPFGQLDAH